MHGRKPPKGELLVFPHHVAASAQLAGEGWLVAAHSKFTVELQTKVVEVSVQRFERDEAEQGRGEYAQVMPERTVALEM